MTYNYNDHPNSSRIYSSITNGKLQTDSRKSRTTSNELIDIRQMHLNYILQDLFRDTLLDHILRDQIRQIWQICQIWPNMSNVIFGKRIWASQFPFLQNHLILSRSREKCVEFNFKSSKFHNQPKQQ